MANILSHSQVTSRGKRILAMLPQNIEIYNDKVPRIIE